jgi:cytochrome c2
MASRFIVPAVLLALVAISARSQAHSQAEQQDPSRAAPPAAAAVKKGAKAAAHNSQPEEEGERIFQQNCSRCHWAPDGFSSRISGTIVRHMRVRASLSQHDEEELLRFLNP